MEIAEAVLLAREGNNDAFSFLYNSTYSRSHYTALKYLANEDLAEDVIQTAYIKAFRHLDKLHEPAKFPAWIARIVANLSINELKKDNPILFSETENEDEQDISDTFKDERIENQPDLALDQKETTKIVQDIIGELSDEQRVCITMFYMDEMSVKEMATMLKVSENTVKSRLNYGRQKIKAKVEELEKKGMKIMGVAPVMFFLIAFKTDAKACEIAAPALAGVTATSTKAASTVVKQAAQETAKQTVEKTAKKAAKTSFRQTISNVGRHKAIATVASVAVVGGGTAAVQVSQLESHEVVLENYAMSMNDLAGTGFKVVVVEENGARRATIDELDEGLIGYTISENGENLYAFEYIGGNLAINSYAVGLGDKVKLVDTYTVGAPFEDGDNAYTDAFIYSEDLEGDGVNIVIEKWSSYFDEEQSTNQICLIQSGKDGSLVDISHVIYDRSALSLDDNFYMILDDSINTGTTMYTQLDNVKKLGALSYEGSETY